MKIRTKLRLNLLMVVIAVGAVVAVSVTGMMFIRGKLTYLTRRSAPFQMRTAELQRALERLGRELAETSAARSIEEYRASKAQADEALAELKAGDDSLAALSGERGAAAREMEQNARDIFSITESRLKAQSEAAAADASLYRQLEESDARLKELDARVKKLQESRSSSYSSSLQEAMSTSTRLREIETFKLALNELLYTVSDIQKTGDRKGALLARSRFNVSLAKLLQGNYLKSSKKVGSQMKILVERVNELIRLKSSASVEGEAKSKIDAVVSELGERTSLILVEIDQAVSASSELYAKEDGRQKSSYSAANLATGIRIRNSEFLSIGLMLKHLSDHLALATSAREVDDTQKTLDHTFARASTLQKDIEGLLGRLGATGELALVRSAGSALRESRQTLCGPEGCLNKARKKIAMIEEAQRVNGVMRRQIDARADQGRKTVLVAQGDQEKAIAAINSLSRNSVSAISAMGLAALAIGIFFALMLERAFSRPITGLTALARDFGNGNFSSTLDESAKDEFGELALHFNQAGRRLAQMARELTETIAILAGHSTRLSGTAESLACGVQEQSKQTEQSASALTEMSQTIAEVAEHALSAADAARQSHDTASQGSQVVSRAVQGMEQTAQAVEQAALLVRDLGASSEQIGSIIGVINEIAEQTNLLALNAAIEAARAGAVGMGFAVVADEVRKLANRTTEATGEITATIRGIQSSTTKSVAAMEVGNSRVSEGVRLAGEARQSLDAIVDASGLGAEMVHRIATATRDQSSAAHQVSASMVSIAEITRETERSAGHINLSSEELSRIAEELSRMASWFAPDQEGH